MLDEMLQHTPALEHWRRNAQLRVHDAFLIFTHLSRGLSLLAAAVARGFLLPAKVGRYRRASHLKLQNHYRLRVQLHRVA